uniref:PiggyBac transposable element-derived protein domain-containing protein n=1 Tax=Paramormyrops kingsleyae TaxID=1676925 RepID=A0A3B3QLT9_9TELE
MSCKVALCRQDRWQFSLAFLKTILTYKLLNTWPQLISGHSSSFISKRLDNLPLVDETESAVMIILTTKAVVTLTAILMHLLAPVLLVQEGDQLLLQGENGKSIVWEMMQQQNSAKDISIWQAALPDAHEIRLPIQYFQDFFDADLLDNIVEQSNLYYTQKNPNNALKLDRNELEQFIGTVVYMSIVHLPRSRMYWSSECRVAQVADKFIHFNDNSNMAANNDGNYDKLFKIRPIIDSLLRKFQGLPQDQKLSVDEQMVPFKGRSSLKQYIPKKPYKCGYKIFVLCAFDTKGLVHSFDIHQGKIDPVPGEPDIGASGNIVLKLAQVSHGAVNRLLFFNNWFSSLDLFVALANKGIPTLGTVQQSRLQGCTFSTDTDMKKNERGTFEEKKVVVVNIQVRAVKWFDNRGVIVASTFAIAQPFSNVERWDRKLKKKVSVECPSIISLYNQFMGDVDTLDALIAYYRIHVKSKKYYHRFFFHFIDMAIVNSWLLYRRDCESLDVPRKKQKDLLTFRTSIAQALSKAIPTLEVRSDAVGHWPVVESGRQRCKLPNCKGQTVFKCLKCNVHLEFHE